MKRLFALILLLLCCSALAARAGTLYGRVVEIQDGKTMTLENTGRQIKVALKLAEPPEKDQPFADAARQHLAGLVLGRQVTVQYTGLGADVMLLGRVFCDDRDIGLQMIRDGVAWFERSYQFELSERERRVYEDSEQAARSERRGIWQDPAPTAPWEWRQANAVKSNARPGLYTSAAGRSAASGEASGIVRTKSSAAGTTSTVKADGRWPLFTPSDNLFSVRIPGRGHSFSAEVAVPRGHPINANFYWVDHLKIGYMAIWASGPYQDQTINTLFDRAVDMLNNAAAARGLPCEFVPEKDSPMGGFTGKRYVVHGCYYHGTIRNYFKIEGRTLKIIFVGVMSEIPDDPAVKEFLDSFVIN